MQARCESLLNLKSPNRLEKERPCKIADVPHSALRHAISAKDLYRRVVML